MPSSEHRRLEADNPRNVRSIIVRRRPTCVWGARRCKRRPRCGDRRPRSPAETVSGRRQSSRHQQKIQTRTRGVRLGRRRRDRTARTEHRRGSPPAVDRPDGTARPVRCAHELAHLAAPAEAIPRRLHCDPVSVRAWGCAQAPVAGERDRTPQCVARSRTTFASNTASRVRWCGVRVARTNTDTAPPPRRALESAKCYRGLDRSFGVGPSQQMLSLQL